MQPYFIWNGTDSRSMGLIVSSYPPVIRAPERVIQQSIPGRSGTVTLTEGDDVYDAYIKSFVIGVKPHVDAQPIANWLRGNGVAVFGNEPEYAYTGRIISAVQFDKVGQWFCKSAGVQLYTHPFKRLAAQEADLVISGLSTPVLNPGDVASEPRIVLDYTGDVKISIGEYAMEIEDAPGRLIIDSEPGVILDESGSLWQGSWTGDFIKIPTGQSEITVNQSGAKLTITPRWRWV